MEFSSLLPEFLWEFCKAILLEAQIWNENDVHFKIQTVTINFN